MSRRGEGALGLGVGRGFFSVFRREVFFRRWVGYLFFRASGGRVCRFKVVIVIGVFVMRTLFIFM